MAGICILGESFQLRSRKENLKLRKENCSASGLFGNKHFWLFAWLQEFRIIILEFQAKSLTCFYICHVQKGQIKSYRAGRIVLSIVTAHINCTVGFSWKIIYWNKCNTFWLPVELLLDYYVSVPKNHVKINILKRSFKNRLLIRKSWAEMGTEDNAPGSWGKAGQGARCPHQALRKGTAPRHPSSGRPLSLRLPQPQGTEPHAPPARLGGDGDVPGPAGRAGAAYGGRDSGDRARGRVAAEPGVPPRRLPAAQLQAPASSGRAAPSPPQGAGRNARGSRLKAGLAPRDPLGPRRRTRGAAAARLPPRGRKWRPGPSLPRWRTGASLPTVQNGGGGGPEPSITETPWSRGAGPRASSQWALARGLEAANGERRWWRTSRRAQWERW